ncbi:MAG: hypothetical protein E6614_35495, partial [Bradyrhizobium sp.]|nr:hypothetical protein [Bradyrhizobium sp.]
MGLPALLRESLELPVVGSPLFIVSGPELVIAQCKAGVVGSFPALNARPAGVLDEWLARINDELGEHKSRHPGRKVAPYAVNQICHASNGRLMQDMETCVKHRVPIIITSLRPPAEIVAAAHSYGGLVFHDVINAKHAHKAAEQGVDGLILVCAGAGGKTLALAAMMGGKGRLIATDDDKRQLAPIHERLSRAGVHNADVRSPKGDADPLADIRASADLVVIDAPCTGTGTWRRNPDAKWRMRPGALEIRLKDQAEVLDRAAGLVKPGGRIAYITCSVLQPENGDQVRGFVARHPEFSIQPPDQTATVLWDKAEAFAEAALKSADKIVTG